MRTSGRGSSGAGGRRAAPGRRGRGGRRAALHPGAGAAVTLPHLPQAVLLVEGDSPQLVVGAGAGEMAIRRPEDYCI
jgi:hypothetical protein